MWTIQFLFCRFGILSVTFLLGLGWHCPFAVASTYWFLASLWALFHTIWWTQIPQCRAPLQIITCHGPCNFSYLGSAHPKGHFPLWPVAMFSTWVTLPHLYIDRRVWVPKADKFSLLRYIVAAGAVAALATTLMGALLPQVCQYSDLPISDSHKSFLGTLVENIRLHRICHGLVFFLLILSVIFLTQVLVASPESWWLWRVTACFLPSLALYTQKLLFL